MENKHKFFGLGFILGFVIPFIENAIRYETPNIASVLEKILVLTGSIWQYVFLYLIVLMTLILYFKRTREKINPESKFVFLVSGVALGFAIISIISATISALTGYQFT